MNVLKNLNYRFFTLNAAILFLSLNTMLKSKEHQYEKQQIPNKWSLQSSGDWTTYRVSMALAKASGRMGGEMDSVEGMASEFVEPASESA